MVVVGNIGVVGIDMGDSNWAEVVAGESACVAPCVVLVINDNPYGLMFALRYLYRSCP